MPIFDKLIRKHLVELKPYSSARDEYSGKEGIFLDANENPFGSTAGQKLNRYPDPYQWEIKEKLSHLKQVNRENIFLGNGSDEAIDLLIKVTCEPKVDNIVILPPTYGMYQVCADIQQVEVRKCPLTPDFQIDLGAIHSVVNENTKIIWVCSPNNPSGNLMEPLSIKALLETFTDKLIVVDEAYIDFASQPSLLTKMEDYANLVVLQTFSKAWGMAGLRVGMAFAHHKIITVMNKIKYPYNLNQASQKLILEALDHVERKDKFVEKIIKERLLLYKRLVELPNVRRIFPTDSNQVLVEFEDAEKLFNYLIEHQIIVRDRSKIIHCDNCLRITVGTRAENKALAEAILAYTQQ